MKIKFKNFVLLSVCCIFAPVKIKTNLFTLYSLHYGKL